MAETTGTADLGLYVPRSLLETVPDEHRPEYLRAVEEFARRKYQIAVEVAKHLPALLADADPQAAERYLEGVRTVADADWRAGVEAARYLQHLQASGDPVLAEGYAAVISEAVASSRSENGVGTAEKAELGALERELEQVADARQRADTLRTELTARRRRATVRQDRASDLASDLPLALHDLPPRHHAAFIEEIRQVADADPDAALAATHTLAELLTAHHFTPEGLAEFVRRGMNVLDRNPEIGRAYFKMATKQALADLEELREGLRLRQVARVLKLYATALSGRDVMIRAFGELEGLDLMSIDHIALPPEMGAYDEEDDNFRAYKVATAHGAGRIEFGTYRFRLDDIPDTVVALRRRYPGG
jgi:hypothetical protein